MKADQLTLDQLLKVRELIKTGNSAPVININGKDYTVKTVTEYLTGFFSDLVNGKLLVDGNAKKAGLRSIKGNALPLGVYQLVERIGVFSEKPASSATAKSDTLLMDAEFNSAPIPAFKNGELTFNQNAELTRLSGTTVSAFGTATGTGDVLKAVAPFVLRGGDGSPFDITMITVGTPVVANHAYKLVWEALEFTPAPNA